VEILSYLLYHLRLVRYFTKIWDLSKPQEDKGEYPKKEEELPAE
jgi:hypothetical protein